MSTESQDDTNLGQNILDRDISEEKVIKTEKNDLKNNVEELEQPAVQMTIQKQVIQKPRGFPIPPPNSVPITTKRDRTNMIFGTASHTRESLSTPTIPSQKDGVPELRKLKISRPCFNPLDGMDPEQFSTKTEAYLIGYLNCLYHRVDGAKRIK